MKHLRLTNLLTLALFVAILSACGAKQPWYSDRELSWSVLAPDTSASLVHQVFLIGDCGKANEDPLSPTLNLMRPQLDQAGDKATLVFLGDNIYNYGLLPEDHKERKESEHHLDPQIKTGKDFGGRVVFVPGNHDWNMSKKGGMEAIKREEAYVEKVLGDRSFLPGDACPGPEEVQLADNLVMLVIDSEWWLHKHDKPEGPDSPCPAKTKEDFKRILGEKIAAHPDDQIIVVAHHPVYSNGNHGGKYSAGVHFAPPLFGSLYAWFRQYATRQDMANKVNKKYRNALRAKFARHSNVVFVSGHEHSLQYFEKDEAHYVVSGSGSKTSWVAKKHGAGFAHRELGYVVLNYYDNNEIWMEVWEPVEDGAMGLIVYRKWLSPNKDLMPDRFKKK